MQYTRPWIIIRSPNYRECGMAIITMSHGIITNFEKYKLNEAILYVRKKIILKSTFWQNEYDILKILLSH